MEIICYGCKKRAYDFIVGTWNSNCDYSVSRTVVELTTYSVTCYAPPSALKVTEGDSVEVVGFQNGKNVRATQIKNLSSKTNPMCNCAQPPLIEKMVGIPTHVRVEGTVTKVTVDPDYLEFDLTVKS